MKPGIFIFCALFATGIGFAEEKTTQPAPVLPMGPVAQSPRSWLGMHLAKPDPSLTAHVPSLPPGIGFVIQSVRDDGPAKDAGIEAMDILWKLDDQMLVNEAQLAALLRLHQPGDEVVLSIVRTGKAMEIPFRLGKAPKRKKEIVDQAVEAAIFPGDAGPMRVVNVSSKQATYSTAEGKAMVSRVGEHYLVMIHDKNDALIYQGHLTKDGGLAKVPEGWRRKVCALKRGLDHSLEGRIVPARQPRPRVVVPPTNR